MTPKRFKSTVEKAGSKAWISIPFDPNEVWGHKERHYVRGSIDDRTIRALLVSDGTGFFLPLGPAWCREAEIADGSKVVVQIAPEGPQLDDMSGDIALALNADPEAKAFFESLATFYRKNYIRWIESAKRPETRAARIAESVRLLAAGKRQK